MPLPLLMVTDVGRRATSWHDAPLPYASYRPRRDPPDTFFQGGRCRSQSPSLSTSEPCFPRRQSGSSWCLRQLWGNGAQSHVFPGAFVVLLADPQRWGHLCLRPTETARNFPFWNCSPWCSLICVVKHGVSCVHHPTNAPNNMRTARAVAVAIAAVHVIRQLLSVSSPPARAVATSAPRAAAPVRGR